MRSFHAANEGFVARERPTEALADDAVSVRVSHVCVQPEDLRRCGDHAPGGGLVGVVIACGEAATAFQGARVLVSPVQACGECARCRRGLASVCVERRLLGSDRHGGCAEQVVASARWLTRLQGDVDIEGPGAALVAGPALSAYGLYCRAGVGPGDVVVALGEGAVQAILCALARARGAKLLSLRGTESSATIRAQIEALDARHKPQHIFVCDSSAPEHAIASATPGSVIAVHGATGHIDLADLAARELSLVGVGYPHPDLMPELSAIVAKGELDLAPFFQVADIERARVESVQEACASGKCLVLEHAL